ncbi:MAG: EamA family transporter [Candidatus Pelethousia sp.]|nr:EamA family transporter [Candidatus Pelethousia sp.]
MFAGTFMLAVFSPQALREAQGAPPIQWLYLIVLGVFSSALAYTTWARAFNKAKLASSMSNYMFITPFLTSVLGFFLADEIPNLPTLAEGTVILLGMLIFNLEGGISAFLQSRKMAH